MPAPQQQVVLTVDEVRRWVSQRDDLSARVKELNRKIDAASVFMPGLFGDAPEEAPSHEPQTLADWIVQVLAEAHGKALSPKEIRHLVAAKGVNVAGENYIYTAIKRLVVRDKIVKTPHGYASSNSSSKEETPDHEAGGLFSSNSPKGGNVDAAPEAGGT